MQVTYQKGGLLIGETFISLEDITENCLKAKIESEDYMLVTMTWFSSRGFDGIEESIVIRPEDWRLLANAMHGKTINFGEIAGKHSDVYGTLDADEITITDGTNVICDFLKKYPTGRHYNYSFLDIFMEQIKYDDDYSREDIVKIEYIINNQLK